MVTISQQTLPLASSNHQARRLTTSTARATVAPRVRWGASVVEPTNRRQTSSWNEVSTKVRRGRRTTVWVDESLPRVAARPQPARPRVVNQLPRSATAQPAAVAQLSAGDAFARNRIRHAFELFGACMMILTFLALAMFA